MKINIDNKELSKKYPDEIQRISDTGPRMVSLLGLEAWSIEIEIKENDGKADADEVASCVPQPEYLKANLVFYVGTMNEQESEEQQYDTVIHEFLHVYFARTFKTLKKVMDKPGRRLCDFEEEALVTDLARRILLYVELSEL